MSGWFSASTLVSVTLTDHQWHSLTMTERQLIEDDVSYAFKMDSGGLGIRDTPRVRGFIVRLYRDMIESRQIDIIEA